MRLFRILQNNLPLAIPKMPDRPENVIFQHGNDTKHSVKIVKEWLSPQVFQLMDWPPVSPDLNPIENFWAYLNRRVVESNKASKSINESWGKRSMGQNSCRLYMAKLYESIPKRMDQMTKTKRLLA